MEQYLNIEFIELLKTKKELNNMNLEQIIKYINSLCYLNYYTGSCIKELYDLNNCLSIRLYTLIIDLDYGTNYLKYIKKYCLNHDIFILSWINLNDYEPEEVKNEFIIDQIESNLINYNNYYDLIMDVYYYESEEDYVDQFIELYNIDSNLESFLFCCLDYKKAFNYLESNGGVYKYNGGVIEYY